MCGLKVPAERELLRSTAFGQRYERPKGTRYGLSLILWPLARRQCRVRCTLAIEGIGQSLNAGEVGSLSWRIHYDLVGDFASNGFAIPRGDRRFQDEASVLWIRRDVPRPCRPKHGEALPEEERISKV